jgi:hypothetical protein
MIEKLYPLKLPPGYVNNGTTYQSKGRWFTGSRVRFFQGTIQPIGGWSQRTLTGASLTGVPNASLSWQTDNGLAWIAVGTTTGLFVISSTNVVYNITPTFGFSSIPSPFHWQLDLFGSYLMATNEAPPSLAPSSLGANDNEVINFYVWTGNPAAVATKTSGLLADLDDTSAFSSSYNAPQAVYGLVTTPERFLFLLRGQSPTTQYGDPLTPEYSGDYSIRRVYWASQEATFDFRPGATNTAGSFDLSTDGALVYGRATRGQTLLWTTTDVWTATYIGGEFIYRFDRVGTNCGIVNSRAAVVLDTGAYWMGVNKFFRFDGFVKTIPCDVNDYVFGNISYAAARTIWALPNPQFNEVTWFYPSAIASAPDRYVTYNYLEDHWVFGTLDRAAGVAQQAGATIPVPVLLDGSGNLYDHETGNSRGGSSNVFLESGPVELGDGDNVVRLQRIVPDDQTAGDVTASLYTSLYPDASETLNGPYTLASPTSIRLTARQCRLRIVEAVATAWQVGIVRLGGILGGRR